MRKTIAAFAACTMMLGISVTNAFAGCGTCDKTIVENAAANKDFATLVAAVKAAALVETLSGDGPFTVFAPTEAAFAKLPEGTVAELIKPENKEKLTQILKYHVVPGKVMAKDVVKLDAACQNCCWQTSRCEGKGRKRKNRTSQGCESRYRLQERCDSCH